MYCTSCLNKKLSLSWDKSTRHTNPHLIHSSRGSHKAQAALRDELAIHSPALSTVRKNVWNVGKVYALGDLDEREEVGDWQKLLWAWDRLSRRVFVTVGQANLEINSTFLLIPSWIPLCIAKLITFWNIIWSAFANA